jgi:MFS family permease
VTTFFYLAVIGESAAISIGTLGFIQGLGGTVGGPIVGWALDKFGPWIPIVVTATACSLGCLWRGFAKNLVDLQMGAILNGVGVNLWTVVLGHLVKSFPPNKRSEVLSGIGVQLAVVQIGGKALFPLIEYTLKNLVGISEDLLRYRLHMGVCTVFCFYGTVALFWDRRNIGVKRYSSEAITTRVLKEKQSDIFDVEGGLATSLDDKQPLIGAHDNVDSSNLERTVEMVERSNSVTAANPNQDSSNAQNDVEYKHTPLPSTNDATDRIQMNQSSTATKYKKNQIITTTILSISLLMQSLSNTILNVLWPLLAYDQFHLSAQTFGVMTFISSVVSMKAVASFPLVEKRVGRVRCAAAGFCVASVLGVLFCICSFGGDQNASFARQLTLEGNEVSRLMSWRSGQLSLLEIDTNASDLAFFQDYTVIHDGGNTTTAIHDVGNTTVIETANTNQRINKVMDEEQPSSMLYIWHAISAIALQASLSFLEPSLKSILSIVSSSSDRLTDKTTTTSLGSIMGFMTTISNVGGMIGNIAGKSILLLLGHCCSAHLTFKFQALGCISHHEISLLAISSFAKDPYPSLYVLFYLGSHLSSFGG